MKRVDITIFVSDNVDDYDIDNFLEAGSLQTGIDISSNNYNVEIIQQQKYMQ